MDGVGDNASDKEGQKKSHRYVFIGNGEYGVHAQ